MLGSVLAFSPELADRVSEYYKRHSEQLPSYLVKHWEWTIRAWLGAEMMSSKLEGQWMIWTSYFLAPKRGTRATNAEIVTLDIRGVLVDFTREMFKKVGVEDRIKAIEGPAATSELLSRQGVVLMVNVFARGFTRGSELNPYVEPLHRPFWEACGEALRKVNQSFLEDPRINTLILPLFDGVTQIKWMANSFESKVTLSGDLE